MSGIILNSTFNNPNLPVDGTLAAQIEALSNLVAWFQADPAYVSLNGSKIVTLSSRGGKTPTATQATDSARATLTASEINGYSAAKFVAANTQKYTMTGSFDTRSPFSILSVFKPVTSTSSQTICGRFGSSTVRALLSIAANSTTVATFYLGSNLINIPVTFNAYNAVLVAWDGTNLKAQTAGVRATDVAAGADSSTDAFAIGALTSGGQGFNDGISDIVLFTGDMFSGPNAAGLVLLKAYLSAVYGLTL